MANKSEEHIVEAHVQNRTLHETVIVPSHEERTVSNEFRHSVKKLKKTGNYKCWICGKTEDIQVHHFGCEWSLQNNCDYTKLKEFCETFDPYGFGKEMKDIPMTSVDCVRNCLCLCSDHHTGSSNDGVANGIHTSSFPIWISQKIAKDGENPVPDNAADIQTDLAREIEEGKSL